MQILSAPNWKRAKIRYLIAPRDSTPKPNFVDFIVEAINEGKFLNQIFSISV